MRALPLLVACLLATGCQEITPPRMPQLAVHEVSPEIARAEALQRVRLGDEHLLAGYYDLAYANYWWAYRRHNQDLTPTTDADLLALTRAIRTPATITEVYAPNFGHSTIARIVLALELQGKYRTLGLNMEYFASPYQAGSMLDAVSYLKAAGRFYHLGGLDEYALPPLKKAISIDSQDLEAYAFLAEVSESMGELPTALSYWRIFAVIAGATAMGDPASVGARADAVNLANGRIAELELKVASTKTPGTK